MIAPLKVWPDAVSFGELNLLLIVFLTFLKVDVFPCAQDSLASDFHLLQVVLESTAMPVISSVSLNEVPGTVLFHECLGDN